MQVVAIVELLVEQLLTAALQPHGSHSVLPRFVQCRSVSCTLTQVRIVEVIVVELMVGYIYAWQVGALDWE